MTDPIPLPTLLSAVAQEVTDLSHDLKRLEEALLPVLLPMLAGRTDLSLAIQRLDPVQQRLTALSSLAAQAADEAPNHPMPVTTHCLRSVRLHRFLRDLRPDQTAAPAAATLFDPRP